MKGIRVVSRGLVMMRQVAKEYPKVKAILVEDACTDEALPLEGCGGLMWRNSYQRGGLEFIVQLGFRTRVPEAIGIEVSLGKSTDLL